MNHIDWFWLITRWLHLLAVIAAVGGAMFSCLAWIPASSEVLADADRDRLREAVRRRWARFVHISIAVLLITGGINFVRGALPPKIPPIPYHPIFGVKLLAAIAIFVIASGLLGTSPGFARMREQSRKWYAVIVGLGLLIVLLSGTLNQIRVSETRRPSATAPAPEE